jgi:hypothetical protein
MLEGSYFEKTERACSCNLFVPSVLKKEFHGNKNSQKPTGPYTRLQKRYRLSAIACDNYRMRRQPADRNAEIRSEKLE